MKIKQKSHNTFKIIIAVIICLIIVLGIKQYFTDIPDSDKILYADNTPEDVIKEYLKATNAKDAETLQKLLLPRQIGAELEESITALQKELDKTPKTAMQETLLTVDNIKKYSEKQVKAISKKEKDKSFKFDAFYDVSFTVQVFEPLQGLVTTYKAQLPLVLWNNKWYKYTQP